MTSVSSVQEGDDYAARPEQDPVGSGLVTPADGHTPVGNPIVRGDRRVGGALTHALGRRPGQARVRGHSESDAGSIGGVMLRTAEPGRGPRVSGASRQQEAGSGLTILCCCYWFFVLCLCKLIDICV
jgi:hypothetical protein